MRTFIPFTSLLVACLFLCCSTDKLATEMEEAASELADKASPQGLPQVTDVSVTGNENAYTFSVTIISPDTGCDQYADWWEVVDTDGNLVYRRILTHSHVEEQPFTRSGGPVDISENTAVYIRAHMNNSGYGTAVFQGSVADGFTAGRLGTDFAEELESTEPLPDGCAF
ncbi:hypothetical protein [Pelagihabitans pacificus]|uniref:hypothetical protein n=1 Tax=Pelagihabitans pacificus TaxID=2696054 RepID=UPI001EE8D6D5|nr:hypothetical protein [Pelagihabitans pacificus]